MQSQHGGIPSGKKNSKRSAAEEKVSTVRCVVIVGISTTVSPGEERHRSLYGLVVDSTPASTEIGRQWRGGTGKQVALDIEDLDAEQK